MFIFNCNTTHIKQYTKLSQTFSPLIKNNYSYPEEPPPMKMTTNKEALNRAGTVLQYCQPMDKNFLDIFKHIWHFYGI
jgi:hypothetical protein